MPTSEAETVAMDTSLRLLARPLMLLVEEVFGTTRIQIAGDNQSMLFSLKTGLNPTMRRLPRTHRVSVAGLYEQHAMGELGSWLRVYRRHGC